MKNVWSVMILSLTLGFLLLVGCASIDPVEKKQAAVQSPDPRSELQVNQVVYKPPLRNAPAGRVSVDSHRGATDHNGPLSLLPLVPDHPGLTTKNHPTLYWYLSKTVSSPLEFTLTDEQTVYPLLEMKLDPPGKSGMHHLQLSEYTLKLGKEYRWFIAVVPDSAQRSKDIIAGGIIKRVQPPAALTSELQARADWEHPAIFAKAGLWYDAITAVSELIGANPANKTLRLQRATLLEQVGLSAAADYDRKAVLLRKS